VRIQPLSWENPVEPAGIEPATFSMRMSTQPSPTVHPPRVVRGRLTTEIGRAVDHLISGSGASAPPLIYYVRLPDVTVPLPRATPRRMGE
jgi:hypothetical protein